MSDNYKKRLKKRIDDAVELRKKHKDPFRNENGYNWDYVMVFPVFRITGPLTDEQKNPSKTLKGIIDILAESGLQTKLFYSVQVSKYCIRIEK